MANETDTASPLEAPRAAMSKDGVTQEQDYALQESAHNADESDYQSSRNDKKERKSASMILACLKPLKPKLDNPEQGEYYDALADESILCTMAEGEAGTGKTILAVNDALMKLESGAIRRILLVANTSTVDDEQWGFMPGDVEEKAEPHLQALYEAFRKVCGAQAFKELVDCGYIVVVPLAFILGRSITNSVIILDESQNLTQNQLEASMTRPAHGTYVRITGSYRQSNFKKKFPWSISGFAFAMRYIDNPYTFKTKLKKIERSDFVESICEDFKKGEREEHARVLAMFGPTVKLIRKVYRRWKMVKAFITRY